MLLVRMYVVLAFTATCKKIHPLKTPSQFLVADVLGSTWLYYMIIHSLKS